MKPSDHPEFFRFPAPEGRSRESTIELDELGKFRHDGAVVEHPKLRDALHRWIARHPDDQRFILSNGYDWTYFAVRDVPYFVAAVRCEPWGFVLILSDQTEEPLRPDTLRMKSPERIYAEVKPEAPGGPYEARFTAHALGQLAAHMEAEGEAFFLHLGGKKHRVFALHEPMV
jgi:hypothetical protein